MTQVEHIAQSLNDVWMLMMGAILLVIISPQNYIYKIILHIRCYKTNATQYVLNYLLLCCFNRLQKRQYEDSKQGLRKVLLVEYTIICRLNFQQLCSYRPSAFIYFLS